MQKNNKALWVFVMLLVIPALQAHATSVRLEEVIVTAQKRSQYLQDVPMAVTALGRELLENNEINNVDDLTKLVPSMRLTAGDDPTNTSLRIRGVGTQVFSVAVEPNVSVVVDEVPLARTSMASFEFADLERIEVLRGPQGTLFGKNATAGLVHVITRDPAAEFEAFARTSYEDPQEFPGMMLKTQVGASGPLTPSLGLRITGFYKQVKGHLQDVLQHDNLPDSNSFGARSKLRWDLGDTLSLRFNVEYQRLDGESTPIVFRSANPNKAANSREISYGDENRQTKTFGGNRADSENRAVSMKMDWDIGDLTLTSITGWRNFTILRQTEIPDLTGDRIDVPRNGGERDIETFTQEFRLTSGPDSALDYTLGALWFDNRLDNFFERDVEDLPAELVINTLSPVDVPPELQLSGLLPGTTFSQHGFTYDDADTQNLGIFAQGTWHITDRWDLTAGARYIYEELIGSVKAQTVTQLDATNSPIAETSFDIRERRIADRHVTGRLSLQYDWSESTNLYASWSTGYRGGAFDFANPDLEDAFRNPVDPETSVAFEVGSKSRFFNDRLELNIAVFQTVFKDFQAQVTEVTSGPTNLVPTALFRLANAGELETSGVEIDFQAKPLESVFIFGSLLYNKAEFNEFVTQCFSGQQPGERGGVDDNGDGVCDTQDVAGGVLPNAPEWSASLTSRYEHSLGDTAGRAYLQIGGRWTDDIQFTAEQHPLTIQEAYSTWDLRLGWLGVGDRLEIAGYVNNLLQQSYVNAIVPLSAVNDRHDVAHFIPVSADRVLGVTIGYQW